MANDMKSLAAKYIQKHMFKGRAYPVIMGLALAVAVGTIWALVRPAVTMSDEIICGVEEHTHSEQCWQNESICSLPEHTHVAECYAPDQDQTESQPESDGDVVSQPGESTSQEPSSGEMLPKEVPEDYTDLHVAQMMGQSIVQVYAQPGTLPENVELKAELLDASSTEFAQAEQRLQTAGVTYDFVKALDISFYDPQGEKTQPQAPVYVVLDVGALLPGDADCRSIQIQHHKETLLPVDENAAQSKVYSADQPEVVLESVVDESKGMLERNADTGSYVATFATDGFSVYTITSQGWPELNIRVQCVDERGVELPVKAEDVNLSEGYTANSNFDIIFMANEAPAIEGYQFDGKAYYMKNGNYHTRIFGMRYENSKWYYYPDNNKNRDTKREFDPQPDFYGENPEDSIRLMYKKVITVPVKYVDDIRKEALPQQDAPGGINPNFITITGNALDISNLDALPKSRTYFYIGKAFAGEAIPQNEVIEVIEKEHRVYGVTPEKREIELTQANPLSLVYQKTQTGTPDTIETVSTRDKGLIIHLFDYNAGDHENRSEKINEGKNLQFIPRREGNGFEAKPYNRWTGPDGGLYTGIVGETLGEDGYPTVQGQSLNYLFDPEMCKAALTTGNVKHVHTNLDHLFWQDNDGYYRYDSMKNFATIMEPESPGGEPTHQPGHTNGGNFVVYAQPALPDRSGVGYNAKFLPFNRYADANQDHELNKDIKEYHFGMTMQAEFIMPPGGMIADADGAHTGLNDMIFEFNGDDDVWVFIDGKLALDLGGVHGRYGGTINFRTGEVTTNAPPMEHSGRRQDNLYGIQGDPNQLTEEELAAKREQAGFGKFSKHTFKFFYLERGKGAANCEITFNLVPVAHGLVVGKRLSENSFAVPTDHMSYQFKAEVEMPQKEDAQAKRVPLAYAPFTIIQWEADGDPTTGGIPVGAGKTDENGCFWLKAGQRADFVSAIDLKDAGMTDQSKVKIFISEIVRNDSVLPVVKAWDGAAEKEGTYLEVPDSAAGDTRKIVPPLYDLPGYTFHTDKTETQLAKTVQDVETMYQATLFSGRNNEFNWIDFENDLGQLASLNITKQAMHTDGSTPVLGEAFSVKIELWDEMKENWIPLGDGSPYWLLNPGDRLPSDEEKPTLHLEENANGQISIEHGQSIHLKLLPGTKYRVSEVLSQEQEGIYAVSYTGKVTNPAGEEQLEADKNTQQADQQTGIGYEKGVKAGSMHEITITNVGDPILSPELYIKKVVQGFAPADMLFDMQIKMRNSNDVIVPLPKGTQYTIIANGIESAPQTITNADGVIQIRADETIHLVLDSERVYSVEEIHRNEGFTVDYKLEIEQRERRQISQSEPLIDVQAQNNEVHNITVTNRGNAILMPNGSFALTKVVTGSVQPPNNTQFHFYLSIQDYYTDNTNGGYKPQVACQATYYGTPDGERQELGTPQNGALKEQLLFTPTTTSGGTEGSPNRGEMYGTGIFLYPGETVVITGLPEGYSMNVREDLTQDQIGNYHVSFQEGERVEEGNEIFSTQAQIHKDSVLKVVCTNESQMQATSTLQIIKTVKRTDQPNGNPTDADKERLFDFSITLKKPESFTGGEMHAEIQTENGSAVSKVLNFAQNGTDYTADVQLKHGEMLTLKGLPNGINVVVQETNHDGYAVSMNKTPGDSVTILLKPNSGQPYLVECINMTGVEIPETGGHGRIPYYLLGAILLCTAGVLLHVQKRKSRNT